MSTSGPIKHDVKRTRGDTYPLALTLKDKNGAAIDITGFTFVLTVDPSETPADDTANLFQIAGVITDGPGGAVSFTPTTGNADQVPATYYYDIQMTDTGSQIRTIMKGQWEVIQDITK